MAIKNATRVVLTAAPLGIELPMAGLPMANNTTVRDEMITTLTTPSAASCHAARQLPRSP